MIRQHPCDGRRLHSFQTAVDIYTTFCHRSPYAGLRRVYNDVISTALVVGEMLVIQSMALPTGCFCNIHLPISICTAKYYWLFRAQSDYVGKVATEPASNIHAMKGELGDQLLALVGICLVQRINPSVVLSQLASSVLCLIRAHSSSAVVEDVSRAGGVRSSVARCVKCF